MRAPPGYALSDYEAPYEDDPETGEHTGVRLIRWSEWVR